MGKVIEKLLEILQEQAETTAVLMSVMLTDRSTSYRRARQLNALYKKPFRFKHDWADLYRKRQQFYSILNKLKREGLVTKKQSDTSSVWQITHKGKKRLAGLHEKTNRYELPRRDYSKQKSKDLLIVSFDVPEQERRKRNWLRSHLIEFGLSPLQKSVWMGRVVLPEEFLRDLKKYGILPYVHVFSINQKGTIREKEKG